MLELCKYAKENSDKFTKKLNCTISNSPCAFQKWCTVDNCMKMTPSYYKNGCSLKNVKEGMNMEEIKQDIQEEITQETEAEEKPIIKEKKKKEKAPIKEEKIRTNKIETTNVFAHNGRTYFNSHLGGGFIVGEYPKMKAIEYKDGLCQDNIIKIIED